MKKVAGIIFAMVVAGVMLTGCYSKTCCDQPPVSYKGEG